MELIDFTQPGGYRLKQMTFKKMQSAYFEILRTMAGHLNISDVGKYIISGCKIVAGNITPGMMYIDGELCPFAGINGNTDPKVKKDVVLESIAFQNGSNPNVFRTTSAIVAVDGVLLSTFTRVPAVVALSWENLQDIPSDLVHDANYVHTDFNFSQALKDKLNGIQANAQVNVLSNWTAALNEAGFILNKPDLPKVLRNSFFVIGDFGTPYDELVTVNFPTVGTSDYIVVATLVSLGSWTDENDVNFVIKNKTPVSFDIALQEINYGVPAHVQNVKLDYILIQQPTE
ncbi:hypothetical protein FNO01nite_30600 [Flavobacterium noncentrifugens]|uniref:Uncharacterized protein n=1 Tax=Flavobacterium noncentrifugens TaxID=1128970 RepID=A0A1G9BVX9_9FLAO|nr:hypothetical protein [Flavobacterium noncentrifugens]GEP52388.1 hypothetical protein FNO01nite_30600 [Flavobacterium noncentrifugens]SDK43589.1 hypothetical protein SAMN04487935_3374 [Flavobacterium noncentrifugens]